MGRAHGIAVGGAIALAVALSSSPARAQSAAPGSHFGERDEFIFSVEKLFGFQNQKFSDDGGSYESKGFHPIYWGGVGLFSMSASGLNFGVLFGVTRFQFDLGDNKVTSNVIQLRPRIGYGGTEKAGRFGYWIRGGPTSLIAFSKNEDTNSTGNNSSENNSAYTFGVGAEAYAVFFPVPHVGILVGPHADFHIAGGGDGDPKYSAYGLTTGIMGEFY
ncbi:MAG: hypothetical protein IPI67_38250 [Myxococcales bacterium]|nr:hypothetical protein [Myxococcales bacterium]